MASHKAVKTGWTSSANHGLVRARQSSKTARYTQMDHSLAPNFPSLTNTTENQFRSSLPSLARLRVMDQISLLPIMAGARRTFLPGTS